MRRPQGSRGTHWMFLRFMESFEFQKWTHIRALNRRTSRSAGVLACEFRRRPAAGSWREPG